MNKTAIMQLIEYFEQQKRLQDDPMLIGSGREAYDDAIEVCTNALNKEKEQIMDAYRDGKLNGGLETELKSLDYYQKTYNQ